MSWHFSLPGKELTYVVERLYEVNIPQASTFAQNRIIPMHTGTITFVLKGEPKVQYIDGIHNMPNQILSGQYYPTFSFASDTPLHYLGIALKPTVTYKLFNIYVADIKNNYIDLQNVIGSEAFKIRRKLLQCQTREERYSVLKTFMLQKKPNRLSYNHLDVLVDFIYQKKGILKVSDLCDFFDVSRRYIEKEFTKFIGFTPGQFIRQVRFHHTCAELAEAQKPVEDTLIKFGYFDRSHFMKKFKRFYGNDLAALTGSEENFLKKVFSQILRDDSETSYHP